MNSKSVLLSFFIALTCTASAEADLTVAVAANVQYAFEEISAVFEKETGIRIKTIIGSSGKFTAQIENGAPFDIFLSADMDYPKALEKEGLTHNSPQVYSYGTLVLWTMNDVHLSNGMQVLTEPGIKRIAIASPHTAPYGKQAVNALKHFKLYDKVHEKLVYGESIAQTNQFITTKAADLGVTAGSIVLAPDMKDRGQWLKIDKDAYEKIAQGAVILKYAEKDNLKEAKRFFEFLFSSEAREIFRKYGYDLP